MSKAKGPVSPFEGHHFKGLAKSRQESDKIETPVFFSPGQRSPALPLDLRHTKGRNDEALKDKNHTHNKWHGRRQGAR